MPTTVGDYTVLQGWPTYGTCAAGGTQTLSGWQAQVVIYFVMCFEKHFNNNKENTTAVYILLDSLLLLNTAHLQVSNTAHLGQPYLLYLLSSSWKINQKGRKEGKE